MPWSLYCASVQENPRCDSTARRLSLRPAKSSGSDTLDGSRLTRSPGKLNPPGYPRPLVASVQIPGVLAAAADCVLRIAPDASIRRSNRVVCKGATNTVAPDDWAPDSTSPDNR